MFKKSGKKENTKHTKQPVRRNDEVEVLAGRDKGKRGKVLRVDTKRSTAIVEQVNMAKKHTRANQQKRQAGGVLEREAPIHVSNLKVLRES
jgi:large subunit ribosomal protein L24